MPSAHDPRFPYRNELAMPVIGLEAEFKTFVDDQEVVPEEYWRTPAGFISEPMLRRSSKSMQLPTGGAIYFDGGVLEAVTPVIEIAPQCTARAVRSLWEQIGFVRDQLDTWEETTGHRVRLQAFSCHVNISFELSRAERGRNRTIQKLALLLAHLLPLPVIVMGANRRSTGIGVRPRRDRIEITLDFTPDPGLMAATTALIVGVARGVIEWPSYRISDAVTRGLPLVDGLEPGRHPSRKGWVAKEQHFQRNPFREDLDSPEWGTRDGRSVSIRQIAFEMAMAFREPIRLHADPFSYRLIFSVLRGKSRSLLDLEDRPAAYDDVGRATRWGSTIAELSNYAAPLGDTHRRGVDAAEMLNAPWQGESSDRRRRARAGMERRGAAKRPPSPRLSRSVYEKVFMKLARGKTLMVGDEKLTPIAVKGWYHSVFRSPSGDECLLSIDQLLDQWSMRR